MYTPRGSFAEVTAFIRGFVSGAARVRATEPLVTEWQDFEEWLAVQIGSTPTRALETLLATHGEAALDQLGVHIARYRDTASTEHE